MLWTETKWNPVPLADMRKGRGLCRPWWAGGFPANCSSLPCLKRSLVGRMKHKSTCIKIKTGRSLTSYCHGQSRLNLRKNNLLTTKIDLDGEKQMQNLEEFPAPFFQAQVHSFILNPYTPSLPARPREDGDQGAGVRQWLFPCAAPSSSHVSPAPALIPPPEATAFQDKTAPMWALHIPHLLQGVSSVVSTTGCSVGICSIPLSTGCRQYPLHDGLSHRIPSNLCSSTWSSPCPCFLFDLGIRTAVSCTFFLTRTWDFLPFLACVFPQAPPSWRRGRAVLLEQSGTGWNRPCPAHDSPSLSPQRPLQPLHKRATRTEISEIPQIYQKYRK